MQFEIGVPITALDLANALQGDEGTFLCQNSGQNYLVVAKHGHSIAYGPRPIGRRMVEAVTTSTFTPEPWTITKISTEELSTTEFERSTSSGNRERRNALV